MGGRSGQGIRGAGGAGNAGGGEFTAADWDAVSQNMSYVGSPYAFKLKNDEEKLKTLLVEYTGVGYSINKKIGIGNLDAADKVYIKGLEAALNKAPKEKGEGWRGIKSDYLAGLNVGATFETETFTSLSKSKGVAEGFASSGKTLLKISYKKAVDVKNISKYPGEDELVLNRKSKLKLTKIENVGGYKIYHVKQLK